jgi:hypothetical protein
MKLTADFLNYNDKSTNSSASVNQSSSDIRGFIFWLDGVLTGGKFHYRAAATRR